MSQIIGWIGLLVLAAAWIIDAINILRSKKSTIPLIFTIMYIVGSGLLATYSVIIGDTIFTTLNVIATASAVLHLVVTLLNRK